MAADNSGKKDRIGLWLYISYLFLLAAGIAAIVKIVVIMVNLGLDPKTVEVLTPKSRLQTEMPQRGNIYDCEGKLLAITYPRYQITIDCSVQKGKFSAKQEQQWLDDAKAFSQGLHDYFPTTSADEFYSKIVNGRKNNRTYLKLGEPVNNNIYKDIKKLPLANRSVYSGGVKSEIVFQRYYPYEKLARRTLGFVRYEQTGVRNTHVGIEGQWDTILKGKEGRHWVRETDYGMVNDTDSTSVKTENGKDLYTTINIDYQAIADNALRERVDSLDDLQGACLILMEVETGAIRAMANLSRATYGTFEEVENIAVGRKEAPGSVFKTVTLLSALNDGYIKSLDETMAIGNGVVPGTTISCQHVRDYKRDNHTDRIPIIEGFKMSSNYVLAKIAIDNYNTKEGTQKLLNNISNFYLDQAFDFDIIGLAKPFVLSPETSNYWTKSDLGSIAYGYSTQMTPIHIAMFYNGIANKGKLMKPYLVEKIMDGKKIEQKFSPVVLNDSLCTPAIADTVTRALRAVAEEGTGRAVRNAKLSIAGKTGTSFGTFKNGKDKDAQGRQIRQVTFVGFFPVEKPKYTILCYMYSKPTHNRYQGGSLPARVVKDVVDRLYYIDPSFREEINGLK